jgi:hypothetical protein
MGAIKNELKQSLLAIFSDLSPNATADQKADQMATAFENAILNGLQVKIPVGKVVIQAQNGVKNPSEIDCALDS